VKRFGHAAIGVDQGSCQLFSDFEDDGPMWSGAGPRKVTVRIDFPEPFRSVPAVQVGLTMWDLDRETNPRADISAQSITRAGFDIVFKTWGDTRVARVRADWMAIGEIGHHDDWTLE